MKINVYPCKPKFYYIKWGLWRSKLYTCFHDVTGLTTLGRFSVTLYKGNNFDILLALLNIKHPLKRVYSKRKEFALKSNKNSKLLICATGVL